MISGTLHTAGLWPPFSAAVTDYLLPWAEYYQLQGEIVSGYRSLSEQAALYAKGRTAAEISARISKHGAGGAVTDAPPGSSAHNYGLAIDIEGRDQATIIALGKWIGFGTVSWDPAHLEWPNWQHLLG